MHKDAVDCANTRAGLTPLSGHVNGSTRRGRPCIKCFLFLHVQTRSMCSVLIRASPAARLKHGRKKVKILDNMSRTFAPRWAILLLSAASLCLADPNADTTAACKALVSISVAKCQCHWLLSRSSNMCLLMCLRKPSTRSKSPTVSSSSPTCPLASSIPRPSPTTGHWRTRTTSQHACSSRRLQKKYSSLS